MYIGFLTTAALDVRPNGTYTPFSAEAWGYAAQMTLLGMLMVFAVLAILWGILAIFKRAFAGKSPVKNEPKAKAEAPVKKTVAQSAAPIAQSNDAELVAIITAAVAAYRQGEGEPVQDGSFRVVSFKRVSGRAWNSK